MQFAVSPQCIPLDMPLRIRCRLVYSLLVHCVIMAVLRLATGITLTRRVATSTRWAAAHAAPFHRHSRGPPHNQRGTVALFSSSFNDNSQDQQRQQRKDALHAALDKLNIDANSLQDANLQAVKNPTDGYDGRYGRSAIRTYRSFVQPKKPDPDSSNVDVLATRTAKQIDFLIKRHKSHETEWVRHHDSDKTKRQEFPLILVLDNVRSAFNVGSLFRTADATGCSCVITTGITPHPNGSGAEKLTKSALGADRMVPSRHFDTTLQAIECLRKEMPEYKLIGMETTSQSIVYSEYEYPKEGVVLFLGNEVTGVDTEVLPLLDAIVELPTFGAKNSLNIAACAPPVLYEILRQWGFLRPEGGYE